MAEEATSQGDTTDAAEASSTLLSEPTSESPATEQVTETPVKDTLLTEEGKEEGAEETEQEKGAPDSYEDFTMPEGVEIDAKLVEHMSPVMKEVNLSQEGAQKLVDGWNSYVETITAAHQQELANQKAELRKEITSVPNYQAEILSPAKHALATLAPEADQAHITANYGDDPAVLRLLAAVGKKLREDKIDEAPAGETAPKDPRDVLAGSYNMKRRKR